MPDATVIKKLQIKPGQTVALINVPQGYIKSLGALPEGTVLTETLNAPVDFAMLFAQTSKDVERLVTEALRALKPDSLLWVCYPKGTSRVRTDLNRDILRGLMGKFKLAGVSLVSLDNTWSAMRFRPADRVGK